ncbi:MAG: SiaC family regulatory phosphoprotein [Flavobacteriales bacterium]|nr:SiaC family regulatory phosphoprotein [Flavobacteriales bacterium]
MIAIKLEETQNTPSVEFDEGTNCLNIVGRLLPEHPGPFFSELHSWLERVQNSDIGQITISFYLYYYNTTSTKRLVMFLREIDRQLANGLDVRVEWKYDEEDEDAYDDGVDFRQASNVDIKLIEVPEED